MLAEANNYKDEIKKINESNQNFLGEIDSKEQKIFELNESIKQLKDKNEKEQKFFEEYEEKEKLEKAPLEFYDIIVDINSMQKIRTEGWEIRMNEKGKKLTEDKNKKKRIVIGLLGNKNSGKSSLLQALLGGKMKTRTTFNTIGLSIKFSEDEFVFLDSTGPESPLRLSRG